MGTVKPLHKFVSKTLFLLLAPVATLAPINASHAQSSYPVNIATTCANLGRPIAPLACAACHGSINSPSATDLNAVGTMYKSTRDATLFCPAPVTPTPTVTPRPTATPTPTPFVTPTPTVKPTPVPTIRPTRRPHR